jgi:HSP20 family protein
MKGEIIMVRTVVPYTAATRMFDDLRNELGGFLGQFVAPEGDGRDKRWIGLRSNLVESDKEFEVSVDLPGMKPEDFNVEIRDGHLWITGERKWESLSEGKTLRRVGSAYGHFEEIIPLETPVQAEKVQAEYKNGVLRITIPKEESAQPRRIEVKGS